MPDTVGFQDFREIGNPRFLHLEEISDMKVVNKTIPSRHQQENSCMNIVMKTMCKRNEYKYILTKKLYCHILKIV